MSVPYILYGGGVTRSIAVQPLLEEAGLLGCVTVS